MTSKIQMLAVGLVLTGCAAEAVSSETAALCEHAALVATECGGDADARFWDACFADPTRAEQVVALGCDPAKSDWWGTAPNGWCWWDWQCKGADMRCRPTDRQKRDAYRCRDVGIQTHDVRTHGGVNACGDLCDEDEDCAAGHICSGNKNVFGSDRGERAGMCLLPSSTRAALTACGH